MATDVLVRHPKIQAPNGDEITFPKDLTFDWSNLGRVNDIDIYTVDSVQGYPLGTLIENDENRFRYIEFGGTTAAGDIIQAEAPDAAHDDLNPTGTGTGAGVAAGDVLISFSDSITLVVNEYAGGSMVVETDTGAGYRYKILKHDGPAANALFTIDRGLAVAINATSDMKLVKSRFKEAIQMPTTVTGVLVGAGLAIGADGSFGWVCTRGPAAVLTDGTVVIGQHVRASDGTAGAVEALDRDGTAEDEPEIGWVMDVGATAQFSLIYVNLE